MAIVIENLRHTYAVGSTYRHDALVDVSLRINDGESVGIIGHTGSGKTTLVRHINGLLMATSGSVSVDGIEINKNNVKDIRKKVGLVFQYPEHQLFEETVFMDIGYGLFKQGYERKFVEEKIIETIDIIGLDKSLLEKSPFRLSGGEKRKVAIAGVLAMKPNVLILDEPAAGLDPKGRDEIFEAVVKYKKENNATIILVSHSMEDLARYVDRIVVLNKGRIEMDGEVADVFRNDAILKKIGLSVPHITRFMRLLQEKIPDLNSDVFTVEAAKEEILSFVSKRAMQ